jgi:septal ring factor EnvC (AmiA/AmiB activator)
MAMTATDSVTEADILAFPADRARPPSPETRLARALANLEAALPKQREAALALQEASAALKTSVGALEARLLSHRDGLSQLANQVTQLNGEACRLEAWADSAIAAAR